MMGLSRRSWFLVAIAAAGVTVGCGPGRTQVSFVSNERPSGYTAAQGSLPPSAAHQENPNGLEFGEDDFVEPDHPAADTKAERALVHIHGPKRICSGVLIGPKIVATAQRCVRGLGRGVVALGADREYRVEIASSTLTWTNRRAKYAVLPECDESELDVAILVLEEPAPVLAAPLKVVSAPNIGGRVQALGFGRCPDSKPMQERTGSVQNRIASAVTIDIALCKGDVGGPVIDGPDGEVIGIISRPDQPRGSPLKSTRIARLDATWSRQLIEQASRLTEGAESVEVQAVACR